MELLVITPVRVFPKIVKNSGIPKWLVYNGKPYQNGWFGGTTIFGNIHKWLIINGYAPGSIFTKKKTENREGLDLESMIFRTSIWGVNLISGEPAGEKSSGDVISGTLWLHGFQQLPGPNQSHLHLYIQPATCLRVDNSHKRVDSIDRFPSSFHAAKFATRVLTLQKTNWLQPDLIYLLGKGETSMCTTIFWGVYTCCHENLSGVTPHPPEIIWNYALIRYTINVGNPLIKP